MFAIISFVALVAWVYDSKMEEINFIACTRITRKIKQVQRANAATELDNLYYLNQIGK